MRKTFLVFAMLLLMGVVPSAFAQHNGDIYIADVDSQLAVGFVDPDLGPVIGTSVFSGTFNASGFTSSPGFDTTPPMFTPGTRIGLNFRDQLHRWTGCGFEPTTDEFLRLSFSIATADSGVCFADGFDLAVESNGGFHKHYTFNVRTDGTDNGVVDAGIYLVMLELYSTDAGLASSDPFWLVLNFQDTTENHDAAITYAVNQFTNPPPCPTDCAPINDDDTVGNGVVNIDDLLAAVNAFNTVEPACDLAPPNCDGSFGNGIVNIDDLLEVISDFGRECDEVYIPECER